MVELGDSRLVVVIATSTTFLGCALNNVVVRLRANYRPKGGLSATAFSVAKRTYKTEGIAGFLKGAFPTVFFSGIHIASSAAIHSYFLNVPWGNPHPKLGLTGALVYSSLIPFLSIPETVLTYRAITTPYKLSLFNPSQSLHVLLSPTERQRPWTMYLNPGLFPAHFLSAFYYEIGLQSIQHCVQNLFDLQDDPILQLGQDLFAALISSAVICPLQVVITRLVLQREDVSLLSSDTEVAKEEAVSVIRLRDNKTPLYTGLIDCATKIVQEEGMSALYGGWWFS